MADARKLTKTGTPGVYRRTNADGSPGGYVAIFRAAGKQRRAYAKTLDEARRLKRDGESARDRGEWQERSTVTLLAYLAKWIETYRGNGRRGFRESTRREYARLLEHYAQRHFAADLRLVDVQPAHLSRFVRWLADPTAQGRELSESSMKNIVMPIRAGLATARADGLIRFNPCDGVRFPKREAIREDDDEEVRALSREQLAALIAMAPDRYRLLIEFVASTGLRISEAIGLQRRHLRLDGSRPHVRIRRAIVKGEVSPPKSRHGRRQVALSPTLVSKLRAHLLDVPEGDDAIVFASLTGTPLDPDNARNRVLKPLYEEIGAPWSGWHTLRHTFASLQVARGANIVQLSRVLGHHSPAFTLGVYAHLLPGEEAPALDLDDALRVNTRINTPHGETGVTVAGIGTDMHAERAL